MNTNPEYIHIFTTNDGDRDYDCYQHRITGELIRVYADGEEIPGTEIDYETMEVVQ